MLFTANLSIDNDKTAQRNKNVSYGPYKPMFSQLTRTMTAIIKLTLDRYAMEILSLGKLNWEACIIFMQ